MTTSPSSQAPSSSRSNGASGSSLPQWRSFLSTLNWRRDPGYEQRMKQHEQQVMQYEQRKIQHEQRMKQLRSESEQLRNETEQLRQENRRLAELESRMDALLRNADSCSPTPPATGSS
jgi:small-conductance mechanosensitive channel